MSALEVTSTFQKRPAYRYIRKADRLPSVAEARAAADPIVRVRLFNPSGIGTWWLAGYDAPDPEAMDPAMIAEFLAQGWPVDTVGEAWGVAEIHEREVGSIFLPELVAFRGRFRLPIERDLYFDPCPMSEVTR